MSSYSSEVHQFVEYIKKKVEMQIDEVEAFEDRPITLKEIKDFLAPVFNSVRDRVAQTGKDIALDESHFKYLEYQLCQRAVDVGDRNKTLVLSGGEIRPWLNNTNIEWRFWDRYKRRLSASGISAKVISEHERLLNRVLDLTGDPCVEGSWRPRKGLVMGNVQAGKTMNFIGLINKSLDVGYHTIVILGGHMDELRNQAQQRIDQGLPDIDELSPEEQHLLPHRLTTVDNDFVVKHASATAPNLVSTPSIVVMKKNTAIMKRFVTWISKRGAEVFKKPFLLIDDEADYASVNTKHAQSAYTSTNQGIRDMLGLFEKPTYVAYTATPFANVFIPFKQTVSGVEDDDLFPSDFMLRMPIPENYKGQDFFFPDRDLQDDDPIRFIDCYPDSETDYGDSPLDWLPLKHKKDAVVTGLHPQLEEAVLSFLLGISVRCMRGAVSSHNTMLVNVTRFNDVQVKITEHVLEYLTDVREQLESFGLLGIEQALQNSPYIRQMKALFEREYQQTGYDFQTLLVTLVEHVHRVKVEMVNRHASNKKRKGLDYESYKNEGYWVIAVGGLKLSRGLTLEGLTVSFFLRNAAAYDTLTQMCRWFGYRDGYEDVCRLYLLPQAFDHYTTVAQSIRELYEDLRLMQLVNGKPRDFGLKVRASETALLVTAKNKMGSGEKIAFNYQLWGEDYARIRAWSDETKNLKNFLTVTDLVETLISSGNTGKPSEFGNSRVFDEVEYDSLVSFVENFDTPLSGKKNEPGPVISALKGLERENFDRPKLVIFSRNSASSNTKLNNLIGPDGASYNYEHSFEFVGDQIWKISRTFNERSANGGNKFIFTGSSSIGDSDDLKNIFTKVEFGKIEKSVDELESSKPLNRHLRQHLNSPVLLVYFLSAVIGKTDRLTHYEAPTVMYILHFPSKQDDRNVDELDVSRHYWVNEILRDISSDNAEDFDDEDAEDEQI